MAENTLDLARQKLNMIRQQTVADDPVDLARQKLIDIRSGQAPTVDTSGVDTAKLSQVSENIKQGGFVSGVKSFATGVGKGLLGEAVGTARLLQRGGQQVLGALDPTRTVAETIRETGFESLKGEQAQQIDELLKGANTAEKAGKLAAFVSTLFFPVGKAKEVKVGVQKGKEFVGELGERRATRKATEVAEIETEELNKIQDIISPKITSKESQRIIDESRVKRGAIGGLIEKLFGSRADIVTQSNQVKQASNTIQRRIKKASELDDFALNDAMKKEVTKIATELKPDMQGIFISPNLTTKALSTWNKLKAKQAKIPEFEAFAGSKRVQKNFEEFLNEVKTRVRGADGKFRDKNLDDLWELRIRYDNSISKNIKEAVDGVSPPSTVLQKEMWLDNRAILNDIINDTASGLGDVSRKGFADMSDLYMARQNIATKSKILTEGEKGLIQKNIVKWGLTVGGGVVFGSLAF